MRARSRQDLLARARRDANRTEARPVSLDWFAIGWEFQHGNLFHHGIVIIDVGSLQSDVSSFTGLQGVEVINAGELHDGVSLGDGRNGVVHVGEFHGRVSLGN